MTSTEPLFPRKPKNRSAREALALQDRLRELVAEEREIAQAAERAGKDVEALRARLVVALAGDDPAAPEVEQQLDRAEASARTRWPERKIAARMKRERAESALQSYLRDHFRELVPENEPDALQVRDDLLAWLQQGALLNARWHDIARRQTALLNAVGRTGRDLPSLDHLGPVLQEVRRIVARPDGGAPAPIPTPSA